MTALYVAQKLGVKRPDTHMTASTYSWPGCPETMVIWPILHANVSKKRKRRKPRAIAYLQRRVAIFVYLALRDELIHVVLELRLSLLSRLKRLVQFLQIGLSFLSEKRVKICLAWNGFVY